MKRLALLVLGLMTVAATLGVAAPASAQSSGNDNTAVATNTKDDSFVFKFAFKVSRAAGDTVDAGNAAAAVSSCSYCETVAVAIQVVLVSGTPDTFTPTNVAIAYNQDCYECSTLADAFQFVFGTGPRPAHLTPEGNRRLAEIRQEYEQLRHSGLPLDVLQARIAELAQEVYQVFSTQLVPAGQPTSASPASPTTTSVTPTSTVATTSPSSTPTTSPPTTSASTETTSSPNTTTAG
jgi:putative peptide zinc metalloprotease protein